MHQYIEQATKNLTVDELSKFAMELRSRKKKPEIVYILIVLGGAWGLHRFYLGQLRQALVLLTLFVFTLGLSSFVGWLDIFRVPTLLLKSDKKLVLEIIKEVKRVDS